MHLHKHRRANWANQQLRRQGTHQCSSCHNLQYLHNNLKPCHRIHLCTIIRSCHHPPQLVQPPHMMQSSQSIQQSQAKQQTGGLQSNIIVEPNPTYQMSIPVNNNRIQGDYEYLPVNPDVHDQPLMNADRPPSYTDVYI